MVGEQPGFVPTSAWKIAKLGESWQSGETLVTAIGQGYVTVTALQLAVMMARLVNGGVEAKPSLLRNPQRGNRSDAQVERPNAADIDRR